MDLILKRGRSILVRRAPIAQLVELRTFNPQVLGSSPSGGTIRAWADPRPAHLNPALTPGVVDTLPADFSARQASSDAYGWSG